MEILLPYDRNIVPQETGWWCGPASTQVVLNSRGIVKTERSLMLELEALEGNQGWDDQDGTDYIGQVTTVLNRHTDAGYLTYAGRPNWDIVVESLASGYGVVANIVAPSWNYPRGTRGSMSPSYGGGTVYHYIPVMGAYEGPDGRHVWIADSGFRPFGYWMSFSQLQDLVASKGYTAAPAQDLFARFSDAEFREVLTGIRQFSMQS